MKTLEDLQRMVAEVPQVDIHEESPEYPLIRVKNTFATAEIALHGAHLTRFKPKGASDVIFLSKHAQYKTETPIRGGIPICWPWFSRHQEHSDFPSHGIARTSFWDLKAVEHSDAHTQVVLSLTTDGTDPRWPYSSSVHAHFTVGESLSVSLTTFNADKKPFQFGDALHCYFRVDEAEKTEIIGLEGSSYVYRLEDPTEKTQAEPIIIDRPIDRIFQSTQACSIEDRASGRIILLEKTGSQNTVVWNPGADGAMQISDLSNDEYRQFVCVEQANTHPTPITLEPGASHTTEVSIALKDIEK
ncbi:MAG: D-hexose-6-phosphate mutarotase [Halioglobus sp.]